LWHKRSAEWRGALGALVIAGALALVWAATPVAHAGGGCGTTQACIHWSSDMIYAGHNNGFPEGPVGEHASVSGEGFTAHEHINLRLVQGDVNNPPGGGSAYEFCKLGYPRVDGVVTGIIADSSGHFSADFTWPAAANSGEWSVCAIDTAVGFPAPLGAGSIDDGPFSVLSGHAPSLVLSKTTVHPGGSVTVTGHHWLPGQDQIFVYAGPCADCGGTPLATAMVTSNGSGIFTATLTFAASATPGTYIVSAHTQNGVLDTITSGPHIKVALAPTPTPKPTATATAMPAPTATVASGGSSSSSAGGFAGLSSGLLALLIGGGIFLLALLGVVIFLLTRRRRPPTAPPGGGPGAGPGSGFGATPYPPSQYPPTYTPAGPDDVTQGHLPSAGD
jgi:hypothetical protein